jgi:hypothetical protein
MEPFTTADLTPDIIADDDLPGIDHCFDSRRRIDAISVEIPICIQSNIAKMNTNAQIVRATSFGGLFSVLFAQNGCGAHGHFCARKFGEDRIAEELNHSTLMALDSSAGKALQDFDQLQRAPFVLRDTLAIAGDISKPECGKMMGKRVFSHRFPGNSKYASRL